MVGGLDWVVYADSCFRYFIPSGVPSFCVTFVLFFFQDTCKICFVNEINAVILPCGHFAICTICGQSLKGKRCPICRKNIRRIQQIFRS